MHRFTISTCDTFPQFNDDLRTEFNEEKSYQGIRRIKTLSFKIQVTSKKVTIATKKRKQYQTNHIQQLGEFPCKSYPLY